jgi:hypothetical protein
VINPQARQQLDGNNRSVTKAAFPGIASFATRERAWRKIGLKFQDKNKIQRNQLVP